MISFGNFHKWLIVKPPIHVPTHISDVLGVGIVSDCNPDKQDFDIDFPFLDWEPKMVLFFNKFLPSHSLAAQALH